MSSTRLARWQKIALESYQYPTGDTTEDWLKRIADFYILGYLDQELRNSRNRIIPAHTKFEEWVSSALHLLNHHLSRDLYGVLRYSIAAELAHIRDMNAREKVQDEFPQVAQYWNLFRPGDEEQSYKKMMEFERKTHITIENLGERVFQNLDWDGEFGGEPWAQIAVAAQRLRGGDSSGELIDHIIDLHHNLGSVFDKLRWHTSEIDTLINLKAGKDFSPWKMYASRSVQSVFNVIHRIFEDAHPHVRKEQNDMRLVTKDPLSIENIENPSEAVQLAAVKQYGSVIRFIKNPSEAVQLAAVKQYTFAISEIENPSEAVQLAAVKKSGEAIRYIKNPSEAVQLAAVKQYSFAIRYIKNPSEAVQLAAK